MSAGWRSLLEVYREAESDAADESDRPPVACPNDGTPLIEVDGVLWCSFDGWQWRGSRSVSG